MDSATEYQKLLQDYRAKRLKENLALMTAFKPTNAYYLETPKKELD